MLVDGASATYGSDAITGVINVILETGISTARCRSSASTTGTRPGQHYLASQLWGRTWDGGGITVSYEWYDDTPDEGHDAFELHQRFSPQGPRLTKGRWPRPCRALCQWCAREHELLESKYKATVGNNCTNCLSILLGSGSTLTAV